MSNILSNKYVIIRNLSLICICCNLIHALFPFPPIIWRTILILLALICIKDRLTSLYKFEKAILLFWFLNLIYFLFSYSWVEQPKLGDMGNISCTLLSIPLFVTLGKKNVMTSKFYTFTIPLLLICAYIYYIQMEIMILSSFDKNITDITNNASGIFLFILPFVFCIKNRYLQYFTIIVCVFFLLDGVKRGNLICAIPVLLYYIFSTIKNREISSKEKLFFLLFLFISSYFAVSKSMENEFFLKRLEDTKEGDTSNRDYIYERCWNLWNNSEHTHNTMLGYGFNECSLNPKVGYYAHSDWLEILVDYGLLGILSYLLVFVCFIIFYRKLNSQNSRFLIASLICVWFLKSIFSMAFTSSLMCIMFITLGWIFTISNHNNLTICNKTKKTSCV